MYLRLDDKIDDTVNHRKAMIQVVTQVVTYRQRIDPSGMILEHPATNPCFHLFITGRSAVPFSLVT